jgi:hypothetical protein
MGGCAAGLTRQQGRHAGAPVPNASLLPPYQPVADGGVDAGRGRPSLPLAGAPAASGLRSRQLRSRGPRREWHPPSHAVRARLDLRLHKQWVPFSVPWTPRMALHAAARAAAANRLRCRPAAVSPAALAPKQAHKRFTVCHCMRLALSAWRPCPVHAQSKVGNKWSEVAKHIPGRTGQQCAQRWRHKVRHPCMGVARAVSLDHQTLARHAPHSGTAPALPRFCDRVLPLGLPLCKCRRFRT